MAKKKISTEQASLEIEKMIKQLTSLEKFVKKSPKIGGSDIWREKRVNPWGEDKRKIRDRYIQDDIEKLKREIEKKKKEIASLKGQNTKLKKKNVRLEGEIEKLKKRNEKLNNFDRADILDLEA